MKKDYKYKLYGAILGDLCGQPFEFPVMRANYSDAIIHNPDSHITDDTIMTLATAYAIMNNLTFEKVYKEFGKKYTDEANGLGYGSGFKEWIDKPLGELNWSYGNGCLMRMSPIMYVTDNEMLMDLMIAASCYNSHAHPTSYETCLHLKDMYCGDIPATSLMEITPFKRFEVTAEPTIEFIGKMYNNMVFKLSPMTILGKTTDLLKETILETVKCGGDTDTNASIIGELVNFYTEGITEEDAEYVENKLRQVDPFLFEILKEFNEKY
jgi:ADP-ribosylglycohydrolase